MYHKDIVNITALKRKFRNEKTGHEQNEAWWVYEHQCIVLS